MEKLNMAIPEFRIQRNMKVNFADNKFGGSMSVQGVDHNGDPYTIFKSKKASYDSQKKAQTVELTFQGHYNENQLQVEIPNEMLKEKNLTVRMTCNPFIYDKTGTRVGIWEKAEAIIGEKEFPLKVKSIGSGHLSLNKDDLTSEKRSGSISRANSFGSSSTKSSSKGSARAKSAARWK